MPTRSRNHRFPLGAEVTLTRLSDDPYPLFHELRDREPVTWVPELEMWILTRRDDVVAVLGDPSRFTTDSPTSTIRDVFGPQMLSTDGESWIRYKRACMTPFRRAELERTLVGSVEGTLDGIIMALRTREAADLRTELSTPLSLLSVLHVLGFPAQDGALIRGWYDQFAAALANFTGDDRVRARGHQAAAEFRDYVMPMLSRRRAVPEGSLLGTITEGDALSKTEIVSNLLIVLFGGVETADSMISSCLWSILANSETRDRLQRDPSTLSATIEEALRWDAPVQSCTRFATEAVEVRGVEILPGETVQCMLGAANRDPVHFSEPDRFDPTRPNVGDHLSFGAGRHFCLGSVMARIEAEAAISRVLSELPRPVLVDREEARPRGHEFRKPRTLQVAWG